MPSPPPPTLHSQRRRASTVLPLYLLGGVHRREGFQVQLRLGSVTVTIPGSLPSFTTQPLSPAHHQSSCINTGETWHGLAKFCQFSSLVHCGWYKWADQGLRQFSWSWEANQLCDCTPLGRRVDSLVSSTLVTEQKIKNFNSGKFNL